jgi:hypothetical protein
MSRMDSRITRIVLLDALLGIVIGSISILNSNLRFPGNRDWGFSDYASLTAASALFFGASFFLATLVLAPFLVKWLHARLDQPTRKYYLHAALAGIVFGAGASAAVGLFFPLTMAFVPNVPDSTLSDRVLLTLLGPLLFVPGTLLTALMMFALELIVFGVAFGLLNGWLVRRYLGEVSGPA